MRYLVISCSLNVKSRSHILAQIAHRHLRAKNLEADFIDVRDLDLPLCDAGLCYSHPGVIALQRRIAAARGIILATAIYNYDVNAAAKNLIELTGEAWEEKVVGFVCAAGGHGSYMSVMPFANSLMLDFRCVIIPRFVYAPRTDIDDQTFGDAAINARTEELAVELVRITDALSPLST
jgi:FMN reductase